MLLQQQGTKEIIGEKLTLIVDRTQMTLIGRIPKKRVIINYQLECKIYFAVHLDNPKGFGTGKI
ncbi:hypothetical protein BGS_0900 [Beggiatoa sp. SS]|nr:hypothetical protein BGS_0900 [Beggiatoa sp. SS]